ncbi:MAG: DUF6677 family protein [Duganella sp.]
MKARTRATLISALLFPGLGHLALKRPLRGCLFVVPTLLAIGFLLRTTLALAEQIVAEINSGALPAYNLGLIVERINAAGADDATLNGAALVILLCWIGSVADAWWLERGK